MLMAEASSIVIFNSTFSWCATKLGKKDTVVAPEKWVQSWKDPQYLIPSHWTKIDRQWT